MKYLPSPPPKKILRIKSEALLEEVHNLSSPFASCNDCFVFIYLALSAASFFSFHFFQGLMRNMKLTNSDGVY